LQDKSRKKKNHQQSAIRLNHGGVEKRGAPVLAKPVEGSGAYALQSKTTARRRNNVRIQSAGGKGEWIQRADLRPFLAVYIRIRGIPGEQSRYCLNIRRNAQCTGRFAVYGRKKKCTGVPHRAAKNKPSSSFSGDLGGPQREWSGKIFTCSPSRRNPKEKRVRAQDSPFLVSSLFSE